MIYILEIWVKVVARGFYKNKYSYLRNIYNVVDFSCAMTFCLGIFIRDLRYLEILKLYRVLKVL